MTTRQSNYDLDSTVALTATVSRMRMFTGDSYAAQGRTLFTDAEHLEFVIELNPRWKPVAQKGMGFRNPENLPDPVTESDERLEGDSDDFDAWNTLIRRASAAACLALSMRNPEWSPRRHAAYRVRAQELLPSFLDVSRS